MNRILIALFATALLCGNLLAQAQQSPSATTPPEQQQPAPEPQQQPAPSQASPAPAPATESAASASTASKITPLSELPTQLTKTIHANKAKKSETVSAKMR